VSQRLYMEGEYPDNLAKLMLDESKLKIKRFK
jgi:hypothetical protein